MKKQSVTDILAVLLMAMFFYTAFSKYFDFTSFRQGIHFQPLSPWFATLLVITLPPSEIVAGILLLSPKYRLQGFLLSLILMLAFTVYVALILSGAFTTEPCPCGGFMKEMSWLQHLWFNLVFLLMTVTGTVLQLQLQKIKGLQEKSV